MGGQTGHLGRNEFLQLNKEKFNMNDGIKWIPTKREMENAKMLNLYLM